MLTQEVPFKGLLGVQVAWVVVQEEEVNERDFANPKNILKFNLLLPNISMQFLHTDIFTFPKMVTRRIC